MKNRICNSLLASLAAAAAFLAVWGGLFLSSRSADRPTIDFLDVGQGDAALIRQGWREMLVDGGPDRSVLSGLGQSLPFLDRRLEQVVATHPHDDHTKGLVDVLGRYDVGSLILPKALADDVGFRELLAIAGERGVPVRLASAGNRFAVGDSLLTVLWPTDDCREWLAGIDFDSGEHDPNNICSLVMGYEYCPNRDRTGCSRALLMADATGLSEGLMIERGLVGPADLIKIGHHGSRFATTPEFLKLVRPENAVIQVGKNRFGHPDYGVILRLRAIGSKVWRNDHDGNIRAVPEGGGFAVFTR